MLLLALIACAVPPPSVPRENNSPPPVSLNVAATATPNAASEVTPERTPRLTPPIRVTSTPTTTLTSLTFALLLATNSKDEHAIALRHGFFDQAQAINADVITQFAEGDPAKQRAQLDDALARRASVIVLQPVDADSAAPLVATAHKANAKIIALDEPIRNGDVDLVVAMDYFQVGQRQAQHALDMLQATRQPAPWNFVILEKRAGDLTALPLAKGYYSALAPHIDKQRVRVVADVAPKSNSTGQALSTTLQALTENPNGVNAILANSPELARGALLALDQARLAVPPDVSTATLDADSLRALCSDRLNFAMLAPYPQLGQAAARAARSFVETGVVRTEQTFEIGNKTVPAVLISAQPITTDSIHAYGVQTGIFTYDQTTNCIPPVAKGAVIPQITARVSLDLWTDEADPAAYSYLSNLVAQFHQVNQVHITLTQYLSDTLIPAWSRAPAEAQPDLVLASNRIVLTTTRDLLQSVDTQIDVSRFVTGAVNAVRPTTQTLGVPVSYGGHLLLFYNKSLMTEPARSTDDLVRLASTFTKADSANFTLAFDQQDPRYLTPWFLAFGGEFFERAPITTTSIVTTGTAISTASILSPTLNTSAMSNALALLTNLRAKQVITSGGGSDVADAMFMDGRAAMAISTEGNISKYRAALGDKLGLARLPVLSATNRNPTPFTGGKYFYAPKTLSKDKLIAAKAFIEFVTSKGVQTEMALKFYRLPALREALNDSLITKDPLLSVSLDEWRFGILEPASFTPCLDQAIRSQMQGAIKGEVKASDAARAIQENAERCLAR
ncbi:MAG TPA: extracellular solute-binding protein [Anaerolineae bacterium]